MQEYQCQYNSVDLKVIQVDRNVKLFGILSLVLLAMILCLGIFWLMVDLKIPFVIQLIEEHFSGSG